MTQETQYIVTWQIDIEAPNPREAAEKALEIQRRWNSDAIVFDVRMNDQDPHEAKRIDLSVGKYEAARDILSGACSSHMLTSLRSPESRQKILKEGFKGYDNMGTTDLVEYVRRENLVDTDADIRWAVDYLSA